MAAGIPVARPGETLDEARAHELASRRSCGRCGRSAVLATDGGNRVWVARCPSSEHKGVVVDGHLDALLGLTPFRLGSPTWVHP